MFKTLRAKLIFSYAAVVLLGIVLAMIVSLALAKVVSDRNTYESLREKGALAFPAVQRELANQQRPLAQPVVLAIQARMMQARLRVLIVDPTTMTVEADTSMANNATDTRFPLPDPDASAQQLTTPQGLTGKTRLPGGAVPYLYVARLVQASGARAVIRGALDRPVSFIVVLAQPERNLADFIRGDLRDYLGPAGLIALLVSLAVAVALARSISRPIARLSDGTAALARGDYNLRVPVVGQDELAELTKSFNQMAAEVGQAHQMERDFVANVSHDLKTPLTSIQGFSQAMLDGAITEEVGYKQAASIINTEAQRMGRLVNELVGLSRLQNGLQALDLQVTDLHPLLSQLVMAMEPQANDAQVTLSMVAGTQPALTMADGDRLKQAFANLIDNAMKHTPPGGRVAVSLGVIPSGVEVRVVDSGGGIPPEDVQRVMERFYQVDKSRSAGDGKSAGLGLAIAREIVRAHHGEISIASALQAGTTVRVVLPAAVPEALAAPRRGLLQRLNPVSKT
ncbi:MAG: sensor histidine kinase [Chloroflexia bacterium]